PFLRTFRTLCGQHFGYEVVQQRSLVLVASQRTSALAGQTGYCSGSRFIARTTTESGLYAGQTTRCALYSTSNNAGVYNVAAFDTEGCRDAHQSEVPHATVSNLLEVELCTCPLVRDTNSSQDLAVTQYSGFANVYIRTNKE